MIKAGDRVKVSRNGNVAIGVVTDASGQLVVKVEEMNGARPEKPLVAMFEAGKWPSVELMENAPKVRKLTTVKPNLSHKVANVLIRDITSSPWNRDLELEDLSFLAEDIKKNGLINPIVVRETNEYDGTDLKYEIVAGERRFRACRELGMETIPCYNRGKVSREVGYSETVRENFQREDLSEYETVMAVARMKTTLDKTNKEIGAVFGKEVPWVGKHLKLAALPTETLEYMRQGLITRAHLMEFTKLDAPPSLINGLVRKCVEDKWTPYQMNEALRRAVESDETKVVVKGRNAQIVTRKMMQCEGTFLEWMQQSFGTTMEWGIAIAKECMAREISPDDLVEMVKKV